MSTCATCATGTGIRVSQCQKCVHSWLIPWGVNWKNKAKFVSRRSYIVCRMVSIRVYSWLIPSGVNWQNKAYRPPLAGNPNHETPNPKWRKLSKQSQLFRAACCGRSAYDCGKEFCKTKPNCERIEVRIQNTGDRMLLNIKIRNKSVFIRVHSWLI